MFLYAWVLFFNLAIANLQRIVVPKERQDDQSQRCNEHLINENFVRTSVFRGPNLQLQYCDYEDQNEPHRTLEEPIDLDQMIYLYKTFNYTNTYNYATPNSPLLQSGVLSVNDYQELPLFLLAEIRYHHIRINPDSAPGHDADEQMELMGQLATDDRAYLLPHSIGGARGSNIVPMAQNVHRYRADEYDNYDLGTEKPSSWRSHEDWIRRFLQTYTVGSVAWKVAVQYAAGVVADPRHRRAFRPVRFALQYSAYTDLEDLNSLFYRSPQTTFLNENDDSCANNFRPLPSECRHPNKTRGIGAVLSQDVWLASHVVSFPYTIENRTFYYGQCINDDRTWFIQELLPNGQMGEEISRGERDHYYRTVFPFSVNGRQLFYSHTGQEGNGTHWFIQELLPDGKMGNETSSGNWIGKHHVSIPFTFYDKQYYYGELGAGNQWYIQELLPNGAMGEETSNGFKEMASPLVSRFVYNADGMQFIYSHDNQNKTWHIRELYPHGLMGPEMSYGQWTKAHHTSAPYSMNGKHFFFGQNLDDGYWFVQELLPNGQMGIRIAEGQWDDRYAVVFAYVVDGRHFMYAHNQKTRAWVIRELL